MQHVTLAHVVVVGTGGTIAGRRDAATGQDYASAVTGIDELLASVPELHEVARVTGEQLFQLDSTEIGLTQMVALARRVEAILADDAVAGVVITHGTDTLEETAFLLNLVIRSRKPVVIVGSMRPADALSADGPVNLYDAVAVAAHPDSAGRGVLVVFDDQILSGRDVAKTTTTHTGAFRSAYGALGEVTGSVPRYLRALTRRHTACSAFDIDILERRGRVEIVVTHPETPLATIDALVTAGAQGIVHIGPGNGNISAPVLAKLDELAAQGIVVVRASRVGAGSVTRGGAVDDDAHGFVAADDHNPPEARILLSLALGLTDDVAEIQELFSTH